MHCELHTSKERLMSEEKILELDKRLSMQEVTVMRVLEAVEKLTLSTEKLNESVAQMTTRFDYTAEEVKELKADIRKYKDKVNDISTEIAVIKRGNKWQEWAERAVVMAIIGAIMWAMKQ